MIGTNFMEEIDCGSFFDHIDDLLEFPNDDDVEIGKSGSGSGGIIGCDAFPPFWPEDSLEPDHLSGPGSDQAFSNGNSASDLSAELSVPYEDIVQLEWLSTFVEDSFSGGGLTVDKHSSSSPKDSTQHQFQTSSPISVLESSTACSNNGKTLPVNHEKRARSKRPRPATFTPRAGMQLMSPTSSFTGAPLSESESVESCPLKKASKTVPAAVEQQKKKKKIKILPPAIPVGVVSQNQNQNQNESPNGDASSHPVRKCLHCEITKTPQWRAGPMGPKTLCNACGVRYKSGRLFPEYRPAASPTFVPSLHSNSHKKVIEMRSKSTGESDPMVAAKMEAATIATTCQPELIPKSGLLPAVM